MRWRTIQDGDETLKIRKAGDQPYWWALRVSSLEDCVPEEEIQQISGNKRFTVMAEVFLVPDASIVPEKRRAGVLGCHGMDEVLSDEHWVEMCVIYGMSIPADTAFASTFQAAERKCLKRPGIPRYFEDPVDPYLEKIVNRIGMTGKEWLENDFDSCLRRAEEDLKQKRTVSMSDGSRSRQIRQGNLTGECWPAQIWGTDYCENCEFKDTPDCGGQEIRKIGRNSKGHIVPVPDA